MATQSPVDFWRFGKLGEGVVDSRLDRWPTTEWTRGECWERFGDELVERLKHAAEDRSKRRKETLFGARLPSRALVEGCETARAPRGGHAAVP